jgi:hypothetical protein
MNNEPLYAWVTMTHKDGMSLVGAFVPQMNIHMALAAYKREAVEKLRAIAVAHGKQLGQPVYLVKFDVGEVLETVPVKANA